MIVSHGATTYTRRCALTSSLFWVRQYQSSYLPRQSIDFRSDLVLTVITMNVGLNVELYGQRMLEDDDDDIMDTEAADDDQLPALLVDDCMANLGIQKEAPRVHDCSLSGKSSKLPRKF